MMDMRSVINDPDFQQTMSLIRSTGKYDDVDESGTFAVTEAAPVAQTAVVYDSKPTELSVLPEGERLKGAKSIYSLVALNLTAEVPDGAGNYTQPDIIEHPVGSNQFYRMAFVRFWPQANPVWFGIATRYQRAS